MQDNNSHSESKKYRENVPNSRDDKNNKNNNKDNSNNIRKNSKSNKQDTNINVSDICECEARNNDNDQYRGYGAYPLTSLIHLTQSLLYYVPTVLFYCKKSNLTGCKPSWHRLTDSSSSHGHSQYTRSMAGISLIHTIAKDTAMTHVMRDNNKSGNNGNSNNQDNSNNNSSDNDNDSDSRESEPSNNDLSKNSKFKPVIGPPDRRTAIGQKYSQCTLLSSLFDPILTEITHYLTIDDFNTFVKVNTRIRMICVGKDKFGVAKQQYKNVINEMLKDKLIIEEESKTALITSYSAWNQNNGGNAANRRFDLIVNSIYSGNDYFSSNNVTKFGVFEREFTLLYERLEVVLNSGITRFEQLKRAHSHCAALFDPLIGEMRILLVLRQQNGLNVKYYYCCISSFLDIIMTLIHICKSSRYRGCLTYLLRLVNESYGFPLFTRWVFTQIDKKCDLFHGIRDNNRLTQAQKQLEFGEIFYESLRLDSFVFGLKQKVQYLIVSNKVARCMNYNLQQYGSLIVLPQSMLRYVCTFLVYPDFNHFVKCNKEILTACIPSWQSSKNKNDNNTRAVSVYNGRIKNERGLVDNSGLPHTKSMARNLLNGLIIELARFHSDNGNNEYNNGSRKSNIGRTIRIELDTLYDHLKFAIPKIICQFENDPKLTIVTMRLNRLNNHLGGINHSSYACILEFIDLIFFIISKRQINGYNYCIKQILHKLGIENDYKLSLLTIIERYGKVELSEITLEKASGIGNIEDTDDIFGG